MLERNNPDDIDAVKFQQILRTHDGGYFEYRNLRRLSVDDVTLQELARNLEKHQAYFSDSEEEAAAAAYEAQARLSRIANNPRSQRSFDDELSELEEDPALCAADSLNDEFPLLSPSGLDFLQTARVRQPKIHKRAQRIEQMLVEQHILPNDYLHFSLVQLSRSIKFDKTEFDKIIAVFEILNNANLITTELCSVLFHELLFRFTPDFFLNMLSALQPLTAHHIRTIEHERSQDLFYLLQHVFANDPEYIRVLFEAAKPEQYTELLQYMLADADRCDHYSDWLTPSLLQKALHSENLTAALKTSRSVATPLISYGQIDNAMNASELPDMLDAFNWLHDQGMENSRIYAAFLESESAQKLIATLVKADLLSDREVQFHLHSAIVLFAARARDQNQDEFKQLHDLLKCINHHCKLTPAIVTALLRDICWQQKITEFASMIGKFDYEDNVIPILTSNPLLHTRLHSLFMPFDSRYICHKYLLKAVDPDCYPAIASCLYAGIHHQNFLEWLTPEIFIQALSGKDYFPRIMNAASALHEIGCLHEFQDKLTSKSLPAIVELLQSAEQLSPSKLRMIETNHAFLPAITLLRNHGILNTSGHHSQVLRTREQNKVIGMLITKPKLCQRLVNYDAIASEINDPLLETYQENCREDLMMMLNHRFDVRFMSQHQRTSLDPEKRVSTIKATLSPTGCI